MNPIQDQQHIDAQAFVDHVVANADKVQAFRPDLFPAVYARSFVQGHRHSSHDLARVEAGIGIPEYERMDGDLADYVLTVYAQRTGQDVDAVRFVFARGHLLEERITGWTDQQLVELDTARRNADTEV